MNFLLLFSVLASFFSLNLSDNIFCPLHEALSEYKSPPHQPPCGRPEIPNCNSGIYNPGCVCRPGWYRDEFSGICVPCERCAAGGCPVNEVPKPEHKHCEPVCIDGEIECQCVPSGSRCICRKGYVRDPKSKTCIPKEACGKPVIPKCGINEVWGKGPSNPVCRLTCQNRKNPPRCTQESYIPQCVCKEGYIWDEYSKKCVLEKDCPNECGVNEEWSACSNPYCRKTCQNRNQELYCPRICIPGCVCKKGFIWDEVKKECVPENECSGVCGKNQVWNKCSSVACRETCQHSRPKICPLICIPGCDCVEGYIWDEKSNQCVKKGECPKYD